MNVEETSARMSAYAKLDRVKASLRNVLIEQEKLPTNIIAFSGKAGSGKDTACLSLTSSSTRFSRVAFAEPIREMIGHLGINVDRIYDNGGKNDAIPKFGNKSLRFMMQTLGTEWGRQMIDDNIWLTVAKEKIQSNTRLGIISVISDLRFDNEAEMIQELGGTIVQIESLGNPDICSSKEAFRAHESEKLIDPKFVDYKLTNQFFDNPTTGRFNFSIEVVQLVNMIISGRSVETQVH